MGRVWQAAGTVNSILETRLEPHLLETAVDCGLRSLFVGLETINAAGLREQHKSHQVGRDYNAVIGRLHDLGVMVNGSFVFGMDNDDETVFDRTAEWALRQGIETATFHILTPYPGTALYARMEREGRFLHHDWDRYDTRHAVYRPARMSPAQLEEGYWRAYREFYRWPAIVRSALTKPDWMARAQHFAYTAGWKKFEPLWDLVLRAKRVAHMRPVLETVLERFGAGKQVHGAEQRPIVGAAVRVPW
jgi:radical SAM superfamily enzyme YgiQ (UPF0313 family)